MGYHKDNYLKTSKHKRGQPKRGHYQGFVFRGVTPSQSTRVHQPRLGNRTSPRGIYQIWVTKVDLKELFKDISFNNILKWKFYWQIYLPITSEFMERYMSVYFQILFVCLSVTFPSNPHISAKWSRIFTKLSAYVNFALPSSKDSPLLQGSFINLQILIFKEN